MPAAVVPMVLPGRRSSAYGLFTALYGTSWFLGSVVIGALYNAPFAGLVAFSVAAELAAAPFVVVVRRLTRPSPAAPARGLRPSTRP
jgi:hypothetical protein